MAENSKIAQAKAIADAPGFGHGKRFRDMCAAEHDALDNLPDPKRMAPVMASTDAAANWLVCSFGNSGADEEARDWHLVTANVRASDFIDRYDFPEDAMTDAVAVAAVLNAYRMGLLVRADG